MFNTPTAKNNNIQAYSNMMTNAMSFMDTDDKIISKLNMGFIADMKDSTALKMKNCSDVAIIEKDGDVKIAFNNKEILDGKKDYLKGIKKENRILTSFLGEKFSKNKNFQKFRSKNKNHKKYFQDNYEKSTTTSSSQSDSNHHYNHHYNHDHNDHYHDDYHNVDYHNRNNNNDDYHNDDNNHYHDGNSDNLHNDDIYNSGPNDYLNSISNKFLPQKRSLNNSKKSVQNLPDSNNSDGNHNFDVTQNSKNGADFKLNFKVSEIDENLNDKNFKDLNNDEKIDENKFNEKFPNKENLKLETKKVKKPKMRKITPWGLKRITKTENWNNSNFNFPVRAGSRVEVYVIDTGIDANHPEFAGRARFGANFIDNSPDVDQNGHGTHVAGIIGSECCGVAKEAKIIGVKVLDQHGTGKISKVIQGIDYVISEHSKKFEEDAYNMLFKKMNSQKKPLVIKGTKIFIRNKNSISLIEDESSFLNDVNQLKESEPQTIINMSVGGFKNKALDFAVEFATNIGIHFAVAAGNDHNDACEYSPSSSKMTMTVGASTIDDKSAFFSNFGSCVDIYAPGVDIVSLWKNNGYRLASGTSMASPHVAGVMALYLDIHNYTPKELYNQIIKDSIDVVDNEAAKSRWPWSLFKKRGYPLVSINNLLKELEEHFKEKKKNENDSADNLTLKRDNN
ncbi:putative subtilisin-like proteinase 1 [Dictyocoela muelleri]|nr:putative subtilisin-like proteinase 1 [Dictyocoela muelleri]